MTPEDKPDFTVAITALLETLPGREPSAATIRGYWIGLKDLPLEAVQRAAAKAIRTCRFMPPPVEIRELAGEGSDEQRALQAWTVASDAVSSVGAYKHVDFADGVSNAVIRSLGGWPTFCARFTSADAEKWVRKEFLSAYKGLAHVAGEATQPLPGLSESGVVKSTGLQVNPKLVRIGQDGKRIPAAIAAPVPQDNPDIPTLEFQKP